jgi:hypothetical protein
MRVLAMAVPVRDVVTRGVIVWNAAHRLLLA